MESSHSDWREMVPHCDTGFISNHQVSDLFLYNLCLVYKKTWQRNWKTPLSMRETLAAFMAAPSTSRHLYLPHQETPALSRSHLYKERTLEGGQAIVRNILLTHKNYVFGFIQCSVFLLQQSWHTPGGQCRDVCIEMKIFLPLTDLLAYKDASWWSCLQLQLLKLSDSLHLQLVIL